MNTSISIPTALPAPNTEAVWESFRRHIRATIARRISNPEDVDDLVQDVFTRIHCGLSGLHSPETLVSWLGRITEHAVIDHYRKNSKRPEILPIDETITATRAPDEKIEQGEMDDRRQTQQLFECIAPMIGRLPKSYRDALVLVERDGLSQRAAAERLGLSVPALKSRVQRARKKLRASLNQCCQFEFDSRGKLMDCHGCASTEPSQ